MAIAVESDRTIGLRADGTVVAAGDNSFGKCNVKDWRDIVMIATGSNHTVGLKKNGMVVAIGDNDYGQCDVTGWRDIVAIAAKSDCTIGLKANGKVIATGDNRQGQCNVINWKLFYTEEELTAIRKEKEAAEALRKAKVYVQALQLAKYDTSQAQIDAAKKFSEIPGWRDADEKAELCRQAAERLARQEKERAEQEHRQQQWRIAGRCQHCGGEFKGLFTKKCVQCHRENGRRTPDSVLATDLYHQLTQEGFKVFFSRITLEDKLGAAYEPYIFAALNSAKVMVVLGTKPEYFNAVWVKNEWSRYLALIRGGAKKVLIPAYRDMDPYDLPEEFSHLQAQDMSKLGFMQDLIRGIRKLTESDRPAAKETVVVQEAAANTAPLLKRAFIFLEDGDWSNANEYCEKVLDIDPECAQAYLGKLMAEQHVRRQEALANQKQPFDTSNNYQKMMRFGDEALVAEMRGYISHINDRNENARLTGIYNDAVNAMSRADSEDTYRSAADSFRSISGFKDADALAERCLDKAEICRKDALYASAKERMTGEKAASYEEAIGIFKTVPGWKDADEQIYACQKKIEEIKAKEDADRLEAERKAEEHRIAAQIAAKKRKKALAIGIPTASVCIAFVIVLTTVIIPMQKYNKAMRLLDSNDYDSAYALLEEIGNDEAIASNKYDRAMKLIDSGSYDSAYALLEEIGNDEAISSNKYDRAIALIDSGDYESAYTLLNKLNYKDSEAKRLEIRPNYQKMLFSKATVGSTVFFGAYEQDNDTSNGKEDIEWLVLAKSGNKMLVISKYALDWQEYNTSYTSVTWETCSLRKWLNGTFINNAFSAEEQAMIPTVNVAADKNPDYITDPGNATQDKVFLLSITEANQYFTSDEARKCAPTDYAIAQGAYTSDIYKAGGRGTCWWWLRSPCDTQYKAAFVNCLGVVYGYSYSVGVDYGAVRPALWIEFGKE